MRLSAFPWVYNNFVRTGACLYDLYSNGDPDDNEVLPDLQSDTKKQKKEKVSVFYYIEFQSLNIEYAMWTIL